MRYLSTLVFLSVFAASPLWSQFVSSESASVSVYQLSHKSERKARRLMKQAWAELKLKHYQSSVDLLHQAVAADPENWTAENNLGYAYLELAQRKNAERAFERATKIDPKNSVGYLNLGICALHSGDYLGAESLGATALRLAPDLVEAKALIGLSQAGQGRWTSEAKRLLEEARSVNAAATLLRRWPTENSRAPKLQFVTSSGVHP